MECNLLDHRFSRRNSHRDEFVKGDWLGAAVTLGGPRCVRARGGRGPRLRGISAPDAGSALKTGAVIGNSCVPTRGPGQSSTRPLSQLTPFAAKRCVVNRCRQQRGRRGLPRARMRGAGRASPTCSTAMVKCRSGAARRALLASPVLAVLRSCLASSRSATLPYGH